MKFIACTLKAMTAGVATSSPILGHHCSIADAEYLACSKQQENHNDDGYMFTLKKPLRFLKKPLRFPNRRLPNLILPLNFLCFLCP